MSQQRPCSSWGQLGAVLIQNEIGSLFLDEAKILHVEKKEENLPMMTENALGGGQDLLQLPVPSN